MELKIFRDTLPQAGTSCTVKAELPLETEILISDYLPPVFKLVKCFAKPVVLQKQLQPGRLTLEGYLRCTVFYQGEDGAEGIPIEAITPQNEPLNRGNSASLFMGWEEQLSFVRDALGPKLKETGLKTKIYAFDHNYNYDNMLEQQVYPMKIYEDENAASFLTGAAYHNYGGDREELNNVNGKFPDKELIFTETSIGMWNDGRNLEKRLMEDMEETALGTVNNWCKAVIVWNLMLDNERGPNREGGCQTCYGAVDIDRSDYKTITRNSHYYIIGHLSSVVKPGAVRIGSKGYTADGIMYSAFENLDGTEALVLLNNTDEAKNITVNSGERSFTYEVPAKAVASFRWNLY